MRFNSRTFDPVPLAKVLAWTNVSLIHPLAKQILIPFEDLGNGRSARKSHERQENYQGQSI